MITIGITTYNRQSLMEMSAKSLYHSNLNHECNIKVYDDHSDEYDYELLKKIYPMASITVNERRLGPDGNMLNMYLDFLKGDDEYFFNADNDLIYRKDWLERALELIDETDGVLSLFNTPNHPSIPRGGVLTQKMSLGAAGVLFKRERIEQIATSMKVITPQKKTFDWIWSKILIDSGVRLMTVKNSLVQHIGIDGHWSNRDSFDYGAGFIVDSELNGQILNDILEDLSNNAAMYRRRSNMLLHLGRFEEAIIESSKAIKKDPNFAGAYGDRGAGYMMTGRFKEAAKDFTRALELTPNNDVYIKNLQYVQSKLIEVDMPHN